jgi:hypothetical protein
MAAWPENFFVGAGAFLRRALIPTHEPGQSAGLFFHGAERRIFAAVLIRSTHARLGRWTEEPLQVLKFSDLELGTLHYGKVWPVGRGLHETECLSRGLA